MNALTKYPYGDSHYKVHNPIIGRSCQLSFWKLPNFSQVYFPLGIQLKTFRLKYEKSHQFWESIFFPATSHLNEIDKRN